MGTKNIWQSILLQDTIINFIKINFSLLRSSNAALISLSLKPSLLRVIVFEIEGNNFFFSQQKCVKA